MTRMQALRLREHDRVEVRTSEGRLEAADVWYVSDKHGCIAVKHDDGSIEDIDYKDIMRVLPLDDDEREERKRNREWRKVAELYPSKASWKRMRTQ